MAIMSLQQIEVYKIMHRNLTTRKNNFSGEYSCFKVARNTSECSFNWMSTVGMRKISYSFSCFSYSSINGYRVISKYKGF